MSFCGFLLIQCDGESVKSGDLSFNTQSTLIELELELELELRQNTPLNEHMRPRIAQWQVP